MKNVVHPVKSSNPEPARRYLNMIRIVFVGLWLVIVPVIPVMAQEDAGDAPAKDDNAKELSGMSIVGNDEAPKSLYIVPWKSSEVGMETTFNMMLNDHDAPVDRDVFLRQLSFYEVSTADPTSIGQLTEKKD